MSALLTRLLNPRSDRQVRDRNDASRRRLVVARGVNCHLDVVRRTSRWQSALERCVVRGALIRHQVDAARTHRLPPVATTRAFRTPRPPSVVRTATEACTTTRTSPASCGLGTMTRTTLPFDASPTHRSVSRRSLRPITPSADVASSAGSGVGPEAFMASGWLAQAAMNKSQTAQAARRSVCTETSPFPGSDRQTPPGMYGFRARQSVTDCRIFAAYGGQHITATS